MTLDVATLTAIGGLLTAGATGAGIVVGFLLKAKLQLNADRRIDRQYDDQQVVKGYEYVISTLTAQNEKLEAERKEQIGQLSSALTAVQARELECVRIQEGLKVQNLEQQKDIAELQAKVKTLQDKVEHLQK